MDLCWLEMARSSGGGAIGASGCEKRFLLLEIPEMVLCQQLSTELETFYAQLGVLTQLLQTYHGIR